MNTNTMELNMNEMEQVNGGLMPKTSRESQKKVSVWFNNNIAPAVIAAGNATCTLGKFAVNLFTGLFD